MKDKESYKNLQGYHAPTDEQHEAVCRYLTAYYNSSIRTVCIFAVATLIIGAFMLIPSPSSTALTTVISLCILAMSVYFFLGMRREKKCLELIQARKYAVLEGEVWKTSVDPRHPQTVNVMFCAESGRAYRCWVKVRKEGVEEKAPLLLVCGGHRVVNPEFVFVLTPYMLTEEDAEHLK